MFRVGVEVTEENYIIVIFEGVFKRQRVVNAHFLLYLFLLILAILYHVKLLFKTPLKIKNHLPLCWEYKLN